MALYEYYCDACKHKFEQITRAGDTEAGQCPKCSSNKKTRKLISRFAVGGQGDLRETTMHGCHSGCGHNHGGGSSDSAGGDSGHDH